MDELQEAVLDLVGQDGLHGILVLVHAGDPLALRIPAAEPVREGRPELPELVQDLVVLPVRHPVRNHHPEDVVVVHLHDRPADRVGGDLDLVGA